MLLLASIFRLSDGLPLSASTDVGQNPELVDCQKYIKVLSKHVSHLPDRCSLGLQGFTIHFVSALNLTFLVLCESSYPAVLAFCFLDDVQKEFLVKYDTQKVVVARRPYSFIDFETFLQKSKQRYNNPRTLTTRVNLSDVSEEIKLRPPYQVTEADLGSNGLQKNNSISNSSWTAASPSRRLVPINWVGILSTALNIFCALLSLTRGMAIISHGHFDEEDDFAYRYGTTFLLSTLLYFFQIYQIFHYGRRRRLLAAVTLLTICLCHYYVRHLWNSIQICFYFSVNIFATIVILCRQLTEKLPEYAV